MIDLVLNVLRVFEKNGLWAEGVELIGSWCFLLYQRHFGVEAFPLRTQDVDFLLPYPYRGSRVIDLVGEIEKLGFRHDFRPDGSIYLWNAELRIDFIVPDRGRGLEKAALVRSLGIRAMPLRFVGMLLDHPVSLKENGVTLQVPHPAAFCLHKLLVAPRRRQVEARLKDWEQAIRVGVALDAVRLRKLYREIPKSWRVTVLNSLKRATKAIPLLEDEALRLEGELQAGSS